MKLRYLADADLNKAIVIGVRRREAAIDFQTAQSAGLHGLKDPQVLALAAREQRILITHDVNTMPSHFCAFLQSGAESPGVFLLPQHLDIATAIEELVLIWWASDRHEWRNRLLWLPT